MELLRQALNQFSQLSYESWLVLSTICTKKQFIKNEFVVQRGTVCNGIYFVNRGVLRNYYLKDNKDVSEWFTLDGSFCFSIISYFQKSPSYLAIQCLEDSEVITISRDGLMNLKKHNFEIADLAFNMISESLILSQQRMMSIQFETALQRYESLIRKNPTIVQRIPLQYIASYLGVTAETLSRIRSQIH